MLAGVRVTERGKLGRLLGLPKKTNAKGLLRHARRRKYNRMLIRVALVNLTFFSFLTDIL